MAKRKRRSICTSDARNDMNGRPLKVGDRVRVVDEFRNGRPHVKFETGNPPYGVITRFVRCGIAVIRPTTGGKHSNWSQGGRYDIAANHLIKRGK